MRALDYLHSILLGVPTMILIFVIFLFLNIKTHFIGIRKIPALLKVVFSRNKGSKSRSPLKSACVSLSATVGTGNIVGVAGAVTLGGAGAVFWMWVSASFSLTVKFCEIYLSTKYKKRGGALEYIYMAFKNNALKIAFLISGIVCAFGIGNLTQTNAASSALITMLRYTGISSVYSRFFIGILFALFSLIVLIKESRALKFCERFLPFMAAAYIILCAAALFKAHSNIPQAFMQIFKGAFEPKSVTAGAVGGVFMPIRYGLARGVFSNEAGLSTAALAYEKSKTEPYQTALFGIFEVFVDTMIICTLTALVLLCSGTAIYGQDLGAYTTLCAFGNILGGKSILAFCPIICFFAFSSVIGWGIYLRRYSKELNLSPVFVIFVYAVSSVIGATFSASVAWKTAEIGSIFIMLLNCSALIYHKEELSYKKFGYKNRRHR